MFNSASAFDPSEDSSKWFPIPFVQESASQQFYTPEKYIRSEEERPNEFSSHRMDFPMIDMGMLLGDSESCRQKELEKLDNACRQWGFFQSGFNYERNSVVKRVQAEVVRDGWPPAKSRCFTSAVNHGIPLSLMQRMKGIGREFVQLPLEEKLKYGRKETGLEGYGQTFDSDDQVRDWTDTLFLTTLPPEDRKMSLWPTKPADFRETVDQYAFEIQKLGKTVLSLLSERIGIKTDCLINMCGKTVQTMRMNYYPPCPRPDLVLGLSPHSDASGLTVLLQDDETVGLHICKDDKWISVQPIPGALVINIGDMIEVISNGVYKSIEHRAVTNRYRDRISIAMFYGPSGECEVGPAPELIDELHPCQYRTFIHKEYMEFYFIRKLDKNASIEFAKIK